MPVSPKPPWICSALTAWGLMKATGRYSKYWWTSSTEALQIPPRLVNFLNEEVQTIEDIYEPRYLIQQGLIERTSRGRKATRNAWAYLGKTPSAGKSGSGCAFSWQKRRNSSCVFHRRFLMVLACFLLAMERRTYFFSDLFFLRQCRGTSSSKRTSPFVPLSTMIIVSIVVS